MNANNLADPPADRRETQQTLDTKDNSRSIAYRTLLVPIDFSAHSKKTVEYATQLAALTGGGIKLLHVLQMPEYPADFYKSIYIQPELVAGVVETAKRVAKKQLSMVVGEIASKGLVAEAILRIGNGCEEIVNVAKEMKVDLIVIGFHSYWGFGRILLGSTLERVLQHAPCPVLVVQKPPVDCLAGRTEAYED